MVEINDRVRANSGEFGVVEGVVKSDTSTAGYVKVLYDNGQWRNKHWVDLEVIGRALNEGDVETDETVSITYAVVFYDGTEDVTFDNIEDAGIFAAGVLRGGGKADVVEDSLKRTRRVIDSF